MNLKQCELAEKVGISQSMLHYILNGKRNIGWVVAKRLEYVSKKKAAWWMEAEFGAVLRELGRIGGKRDVR